MKSVKNFVKHNKNVLPIKSEISIKKRPLNNTKTIVDECLKFAEKLQLTVKSGFSGTFSLYPDLTPNFN